MKGPVCETCRCGVEVMVAGELPTCALCGEGYCDECLFFVGPGLHGHRDCVFEDSHRRAELRQLIYDCVVDMPVQRLRRVAELAGYLSPGKMEGARAVAERRRKAMVMVKRAS